MRKHLNSCRTDMAHTLTALRRIKRERSATDRQLFDLTPDSPTLDRRTLPTNRFERFS